ncbi:hypothetical protein [Bacillus cereus]|uniref:hypothetical protein n=1 Tax=Bacillus cereus TaxID=1396 RepID=UPI000BFA8D4C|nr:hypothetical protein [Bacillus cereus]PFK68244.1 hypothetical protein COJ25_17045 [Bacillus cereus]
MAGTPTITLIEVTVNGNAVVNFSYSGGSTTDIIYLERMDSNATTGQQKTIRQFIKGDNTYTTDFTLSNSGAKYLYRFRATNANGTGAVYSDWVEAQTQCLDIVTLAPYNEMWTRTQLKVVQSRSGKKGRETQLMEFAGRKKPAAEVGMMRNQSVDITLWVETTQEVYDIERLLLDNDFWFRDNYGRSFHGVCSDVSVSDYIGGYNMSATLTEIDGEGIN